MNEQEMMMTHAPKFWADKLAPEYRQFFWAMVEFGFGGESAYYRTIRWYDMARNPEAA